MSVQWRTVPDPTAERPVQSEATLFGLKVRLTRYPTGAASFAVIGRWRDRSVSVLLHDPEDPEGDAAGLAELLADAGLGLVLEPDL